MAVIGGVGEFGKYVRAQLEKHKDELWKEYDKTDWAKDYWRGPDKSVAAVFQVDPNPLRQGQIKGPYDMIVMDDITDKKIDWARLVEAWRPVEVTSTVAPPKPDAVVKAEALQAILNDPASQAALQAHYDKHFKAIMERMVMPVAEPAKPAAPAHPVASAIGRLRPIKTPGDLVRLVGGGSDC